MKIVYGDQVIENASVVIQPSRLCPHDEPGRIIKLIELTVPADASNGGYAVRQLLGQDPDICAKSVVTLEVALTQQQISRLENITEDDLRDIRNGVNPAMIFGVRVYDSEPIDVEEFITGKKWPRWFTPSQNMKDATGTEIICFRRDSQHSGETFCIGGKSYTWHEWKGDDLQFEEITEQEAQAIIAHSVKPTGEWLGCVQWFQHQNPNVIIRRDSHDRCTYCEYDREPVSGLVWSENFTEWVKSREWIEITHDEAEKRIEYNRRFAGLTPPYPKPQMCKREQYAGGGTPSPRNCDVCLEGPCQRVIPVQTEEAASPAMQALRKLAQQRGIDPAGMASKAIADALIAANQQIAAETSNLQQTVERSFEQLPADCDMVIKRGDKSLGCDNEAACLEKAWVTTNEPIRLSDCVNHLYGKEPGSDCLCEACGRGPCTRIPVNILPQVRNAAEPKPIPRNIPNLAFVGIDWAKRSDVAATQQVNLLPFSLGEVPLQLELRSSFDSEGIWLYAVDDDLRLAFVRAQDVGTKSYTFTIEVPCIQLCGYPRVKWPVGYRHAVMPKDYGKEVMYFSDTRTGWGRGILRGMEKNNTEADRMIIDLPAKDEMFDPERITVGARLVFIIDQPTEGF